MQIEEILRSVWLSPGITGLFCHPVLRFPSAFISLSSGNFPVPLPRHHTGGWLEMRNTSREGLHFSFYRRFWEAAEEVVEGGALKVPPRSEPHGLVSPKCPDSWPPFWVKS